MSNICPLSMENKHDNVEFGVLQKTSKQSLIVRPYPPRARDIVPRSRASPLFTQIRPPHPQIPRSAPGVSDQPVMMINIIIFKHYLFLCDDY